jgi:hypothetical protein
MTGFAEERQTCCKKSGRLMPFIYRLWQTELTGGLKRN